MRRTPTGAFDFATGAGCWLRYGMCFLGAIVVAGALFVLMKALIRAPRTQASSRSAPVFLLDRAVSAVYADVMRGQHALFAHEVTCNPAAHETPGETLLEELRKRGFTKPKAGGTP